MNRFRYSLLIEEEKVKRQKFYRFRIRKYLGETVLFEGRSKYKLTDKERIRKYGKNMIERIRETGSEKHKKLKLTDFYAE